MAHRLPITIRLESFEGPLDLLLYLIQSHELDISKVSISKITDQYLAYVLLMQELNFDVASEFLVMAATLLHWKSKSLLPQEDSAQSALETGDEDAFTPEDLIRQMLEHQRFLNAGEELGQLPLLDEDVFTRYNLKPPLERVWKEMKISDLALTYQQVLIHERKRVQILRKETVSLTEKIEEFGRRLDIGKLSELASLMPSSPIRPEIVVTFLAALELARLKKLRVYQNQTFDPIYVELLEKLSQFDLKLAVGFENEIQPAPTSLGGTP